MLEADVAHIYAHVQRSTFVGGRGKLVRRIKRVSRLCLAIRNYSYFEIMIFLIIIMTDILNGVRTSHLRETINSTVTSTSSTSSI
jgi:hypothetical protein